MEILGNAEMSAAKCGEGMGAERGAPASGSPFPSSPRVIFAKAPLAEVIAQLRFPPLLRLESELPANFQERIRKEFPFFEKGAQAVFPQMPAGSQIPAELMQILSAAQVGGIAYRFFSEDRTSTITLAPGALTLSTTSYSRWEDFLRQFRLPFAALLEIYKPSFITRVGLRYVNAIEKEALGFPNDTSWTRLLRKELLGELSLSSFEDSVVSFASQMTVKLPDDSGRVLFQQAIATLQNHTEPAYVIDFDFAAEKRTEATDAERVLSDFHRLAGNAFRWCITDELRAVLGPQQVGDDEGQADARRA